MECARGIGSVMKWKLSCHARGSGPRQQLRTSHGGYDAASGNFVSIEQGPNGAHVATRLPAFKETR